MSENRILNIAKNVFDIEIGGLQQVKEQLGDSFIDLVNQCIRTFDGGGKIVLSGVGKSGYIGKKIAATLASTGSPTVFLHPVEALHGDLGILQQKDLLIALSYSGETDELLSILPSAKRLGVTVAAITGDSTSQVAKWSDIVVQMAVPREACPFNLAPTTTATTLLALGDALAMVLLEVRGFTKEDYGRLHPGGAIGRAVTMKVSDVMRTGERFAIVGVTSTVRDTLLAMTKARSGSAVVVDFEGKLLGIFTDGDFRRRAEEDLSVIQKLVIEVMTKNPTSISKNAMAIEILKLVESKHIDDIVVVDDQRVVVGMVDIQDLPGLKLM